MGRERREKGEEGERETGQYGGGWAYFTNLVPFLDFVLFCETGPHYVALPGQPPAHYIDQAVLESPAICLLLPFKYSN